METVVNEKKYHNHNKNYQKDETAEKQVNSNPQPTLYPTEGHCNSLWGQKKKK